MKKPASNFITVTQRNGKTGRTVTYRRLKPQATMSARGILDRRGHGSPRPKRYEDSNQALIDSVARGYLAFCRRRGLDPHSPNW